MQTSNLSSLLNPAQAGFMYESLMLNANEIKAIDGGDSKQYEEEAQYFRDSIEANCGWDDYQKLYQTNCKAMAESVV